MNRILANILRIDLLSRIIVQSDPS